MALVAIALLSLLAAILSGTASLKGPRTVRVGEFVTVRLSDLRAAGDYQLFLVTPYDTNAEPGATTQCTAPISGLERAHGAATFSGRVPDVLDCRANLTPTGTRQVTPGAYQFEVYSPADGHPNKHLANVIEPVRIEK
jgi:hypothetical protein